MKKEQKKRISNIIERLKGISAEIAAIADEQQEKFDNANEGLQATERFQLIQEEADTLYSIQSDIEEASDALLEYSE